MTLPSESLGVVAYAANDLRVEPVPLRELPALRRGVLRTGSLFHAGEPAALHTHLVLQFRSMLS
jgi:hypothetical protein